MMIGCMRWKTKVKPVDRCVLFANVPNDDLSTLAGPKNEVVVGRMELGGKHSALDVVKDRHCQAMQ